MDINITKNIQQKLFQLGGILIFLFILYLLLEFVLNFLPFKKDINESYSNLNSIDGFPETWSNVTNANSYGIKYINNGNTVNGWVFDSSDYILKITNNPIPNRKIEYTKTSTENVQADCENACESIGMEPACITNSYENRKAGDIASSLPEEKAGLWLGISKSSNDSEWTCGTLGELNYENWNIPLGDKLGSIILRNGKWSDKSKSLEHACLCSSTLALEPNKHINANINTNTNEYRYNSYTYAEEIINDSTPNFIILKKGLTMVKDLKYKLTTLVNIGDDIIEDKLHYVVINGESTNKLYPSGSKDSNGFYNVEYDFIADTVDMSLELVSEMSSIYRNKDGPEGEIEYMGVWKDDDDNNPVIRGGPVAVDSPSKEVDDIFNNEFMDEFADSRQQVAYFAIKNNEKVYWQIGEGDGYKREGFVGDDDVTQIIPTDGVIKITRFNGEMRYLGNSTGVAVYKITRTGIKQNPVRWKEIKITYSRCDEDKCEFKPCGNQSNPLGYSGKYRDGNLDLPQETINNKTYYYKYINLSCKSDATNCYDNSTCGSCLPGKLYLDQSSLENVGYRAPGESGMENLPDCEDQEQRVFSEEPEETEETEEESDSISAVDVARGVASGGVTSLGGAASLLGGFVQSLGGGLYAVYDYDTGKANVVNGAGTTVGGAENLIGGLIESGRLPVNALFGAVGVDLVTGSMEEKAKISQEEAINNDSNQGVPQPYRDPIKF